MGPEQVLRRGRTGLAVLLSLRPRKPQNQRQPAPEGEAAD